MKIDADLIDALLYEEESSTIDFKVEAYPFSSASDEAKSEMLKDLLAFANGWRRSDAFILLGIEEVKGGKSIVRGISEVYDDAHIQQFVNSKTQRPMVFSFQAVQINELKVGVFHIPQQERPIYLKKDFGKLKKDQVILRRGSSTSIADPDEISKMRLADQNIESKTPSFELNFAEPNSMRCAGNIIDLEVYDYNRPSPETIPDCGYSHSSLGYGSTISHYDGISNRDFYREFVDYVCAFGQVKKVMFSIHNTSGVAGSDVKVEIKLNDPQNTLILFDEYNRPRAPDKNRFPALYNLNMPSPTWDTIVESRETEHIIEIDFGKIRPKRTEISTGCLYIGSTKDIDLEFTAQIFADNLPNPVSQKMSISIKVKRREIDLDSILND